MKSPRILLALLLWPILAASAKDPARPNILILLADDLGWSDLGCYGGEIRTPNLDALAAGGLRFTQFYNAARCCPSRASILTGLYPQQAGVGLMTADQKLPGYRGTLAPTCVTLGQVMHSAGYRTAAVGKWHVGDDVLPTDRGFDDFYGFNRGYAVDSWQPGMMVRLPKGEPQHTYPEGKFYATDAIGDHALDFIATARVKDQPWFMYVAFQAPHFPLQAKTEDLAGYPEIYAQGWDRIRAQRLERQVKMGLVPANTPLTPRSAIPHRDAAVRMGSDTADGNNAPWDSLPADRRADLAQRMAVFAGMVTGVDRNVGRLVADLRAHGDLENTLILFMSDNGACAEWEPFGFDLSPAKVTAPGHGTNQGTQAGGNTLHRGEELKKMGQPGTFMSYGCSWANACNTPWRLYKHYDHEGGISSPLIVHWPAQVKAAGEIRNQVGHIIDLMPTCAEVAGATYPAEVNGEKIQPMEGRSLVPAFANQPVQRDDLGWEHEHNRAFRVGDWKIAAVGDGPWELYDLSKDRVELHDLAEAQPARLKEMAAQWEAWAHRTQVLPQPPHGPWKE